MIQIRKFRDSQGRIPFDEWLLNLKDGRARERIKVRVDRLSIGLEGDWKSVGEGVRELRVPEGKGYRVYQCHSVKATPSFRQGLPEPRSDGRQGKIHIPVTGFRQSLAE
jgi:putative addiction module killer protein